MKVSKTLVKMGYAILEVKATLELITLDFIFS